MTPTELANYVLGQDPKLFWKKESGPLAPAMRMARLYHADQLYGEEDYTSHLFYTMWLVADLSSSNDQITKDYYILALLHDCYEDARDKFPHMLETIYLCFGDEMVEHIKTISRNPNESRSDYYKRIAAASSPVVSTVKACDRFANCTYGSLVPTSKQQKYWDEYPEFREAIVSSAVPESITRLDHWYFNFQRTVKNKS